MNENIDCIRLKEDLQRQVAERYSGLDESEKHDAMIVDIQADPLLGPIWKNAVVVVPSDRRVAMKAGTESNH